MYSDLDEIPRASVVQELKHCKGYRTPGCFHTRMYYYGFEYLNAEEWYHPNFSIFDSDNPKPINRWRSHLASRVQKTRLPNSGWHIGWAFKTIEEYRKKMKWDSHHSDKHTTRMLGATDGELVQMILEGTDIVKQYGHGSYFAPPLKLIPQHEFDMPSWLLFERPVHLSYLWDRKGWANAIEQERTNHS